MGGFLQAIRDHIRHTCRAERQGEHVVLTSEPFPLAPPEYGMVGPANPPAAMVRYVKERLGDVPA